MNNKNYSFKKFVNSKFFYVFSSFTLGLILMFVLLKFNDKEKIDNNIVSKNIKTTTVEETSNLKTAINNIYESAVYIEVSVNSSNGNMNSISSGSGFVYKKDNDNIYILTNYHVVDKGTGFTVTFTNSKEMEATLVGGDEYYDIAVLKVKKDDTIKVANIGDSSKLELGDTVFTVGAPLGKDYMGTITKGIISGINRMLPVELSTGSYLMEVIQTDASINSGNSGGPICNIKGQIIGITSSKLVGNGVEGMGFAIPINSVMEIIDNLEKGKKIVRPYLGAQLVDLNNTFYLQYYYGIKISSDVKFGAVINYIEDSKPASKAGLKIGDIIVDMDDKKVEDASHFKYLLYKHKIGDKIKIKYYRDNKLNDATIELTESIKSE